jgi:hypothetical protein
VSSAGCNCLDACGCCEDQGDLTPLALENPPGLFELAYRVGTHGSFKETMIRQLPVAGPAGHPLSALTTREDDDPTIGLIDAWASVLDVLTFYQERIVNEGFLRTATERRSIRELANAIGYKLAPGAAACAYLAFDLETAEGAPKQVTIGKGVKVQSVPGPDELPQTFETIEEIEARPEWNAIEPRVTKTQTLTRDAALPRGRGQRQERRPASPCRRRAEHPGHRQRALGCPSHRVGGGRSGRRLHDRHLVGAARQADRRPRCHAGRAEPQGLRPARPRRVLRR